MVYKFVWADGKLAIGQQFQTTHYGLLKQLGFDRTDNYTQNEVAGYYDSATGYIKILTQSGWEIPSDEQLIAAIQDKIDKQETHSIVSNVTSHTLWIKTTDGRTYTLENTGGISHWHLMKKYNIDSNDIEEFGYGPDSLGTYNEVPPPGNDKWGHHWKGMKHLSENSGVLEKFSEKLSMKMQVVSTGPFYDNWNSISSPVIYDRDRNILYIKPGGGNFGHYSIYDYMRTHHIQMPKNEFHGYHNHKGSGKFYWYGDANKAAEVEPAMESAINSLAQDYVGHHKEASMQKEAGWLKSWVYDTTDGQVFIGRDHIDIFQEIPDWEEKAAAYQLICGWFVGEGIGEVRTEIITDTVDPKHADPRNPLAQQAKEAALAAFQKNYPEYFRNGSHKISSDPWIIWAYTPAKGVITAPGYTEHYQLIQDNAMAWSSHNWCGGHYNTQKDLIDPTYNIPLYEKDRDIIDYELGRYYAGHEGSYKAARDLPWIKLKNSQVISNPSIGNHMTLLMKYNIPIEDIAEFGGGDVAGYWNKVLLNNPESMKHVLNLKKNVYDPDIDAPDIPQFSDAPHLSVHRHVSEWHYNGAFIYSPFTGLLLDQSGDSTHYEILGGLDYDLLNKVVNNKMFVGWIFYDKDIDKEVAIPASVEYGTSQSLWEETEEVLEKHGIELTQKISPDMLQFDQEDYPAHDYFNISRVLAAPEEHFDIPDDAREYLTQFWNDHPDLRKECEKKYGYDPINESANYWSHGIPDEPEHSDILNEIKENNNIFSLDLAKKWKAEELKAAKKESAAWGIPMVKLKDGSILVGMDGEEHFQLLHANNLDESSVEDFGVQYPNGDEHWFGSNYPIEPIVSATKEAGLPYKFIWADGNLVVEPGWNPKLHHIHILRNMGYENHLPSAYAAGVYSVSDYHVGPDNYPIPWVEIIEHKGLTPNDDQLGAMIREKLMEQKTATNGLKEIDWDDYELLNPGWSDLQIPWMEVGKNVYIGKPGEDHYNLKYQYNIPDNIIGSSISGYFLPPDYIYFYGAEGLDPIIKKSIMSKLTPLFLTTRQYVSSEKLPEHPGRLARKPY